jgi:FkbM family methyltransferase
MLKAIVPSAWVNALSRIYHRLKGWYFKHLMHDYSEARETMEIRRLLRAKKGDKRFFVELGANDGVTLSSTLGLIRDGWSGLAVEANPAVFARLKNNWQAFSKVKIVCAAVAPEAGPVKLYLGKNDPDGLLSTISTEESEWFKEHRSENSVEVSGIPLTVLLDREGAPQRPDLLLVDTEGMDYDILLTLDFQKYRPKLIVTEDYEPKNADKFDLLRRTGYSFSKRVGCNTFWVDIRANQE